MQSFEVFLFGTPRFKRDGGSIHIGRRKSIALLAYLLTTHQTISRDSLATMLWPEYDQSSARANLRRELSRLKKAIGEGVISVGNEEVTLLNETKICLDIDEFQSKLAGIRKYFTQNEDFTKIENNPICVSELREAIEIYVGDFMEGFSLLDSPSFDEWQFFQAEKLRRLLAKSLQQMIGWLVRLGEFEEAIGHSRRWLFMDRLHEPAHRQLMELYVLSDQRSAALRQYQECKRLLRVELGIEPDEKTSALYDSIKTKRFDLHPQLKKEYLIKAHLNGKHISDDGQYESKFAPQIKRIKDYSKDKQRKHDLKSSLTFTSPTLFIGREHEKEHIRNLLVKDPSCRLLSIIGTGGLGKTYLALEVGSASQLAFDDGVYFIPLAQISMSDQIIPTLAKALDFRFHESANPKRQVLDYLSEKEMLLVIDNFDHMLSGAELVLEILKAAPRVKVLVTSRERLNLSDEVLFTLSEMSYPSKAEALVPNKEKLMEYDAIKLLYRSALKARPDFEFQENDLKNFVQICQLVEGMPLAIVLAAGWMEMLSPKEIADEIKTNLDFLSSQALDLPERQKSLRAVFNTSWSLLENHEKKALKQLTIFKGGFSRHAAQEVTDVSMKTLLRLKQKSWLIVRENNRFHT